MTNAHFDHELDPIVPCLTSGVYHEMADHNEVLGYPVWTLRLPFATWTGR